VVLVDKKGVPYDYTIVEYDITHQIVEEFMLLANAVVAKHIAKQGVSGLFRVHEMPDQESVEEFYSFARMLGFSLPSKPLPADIQNLFAQAKQTPYAQQLAVSFIRSMKLAAYSHENVGHYGLALEHYSHFTSPIRRYSDLILHRLLFKKKDSKGLDQISRYCSEKERMAAKAEFSVITMKKLRWLDLYNQNHPNAHYQATITKIKSFGLYFDAAPLSIEGFLHVSDLGDDYYEYHPQAQRLAGKNSRQIFKMGDAIRVKVAKIDLITVEILWTLLTPSKPRLANKNTQS
jgi:ribonuclease R